MNYFFFSLQRSGHLSDAFEKLFLRFWKRYIQKSGDTEIVEIAAPFLVFRALVLAHPVWYPNLSDELREKLFRFMDRILHADVFRPESVDEYCRT
jgi:hypothetical protein